MTTTLMKLQCCVIQRTGQSSNYLINQIIKQLTDRPTIAFVLLSKWICLSCLILHLIGQMHQGHLVGQFYRYILIKILISKSGSDGEFFRPIVDFWMSLHLIGLSNSSVNNTLTRLCIKWRYFLYSLMWIYIKPNCWEYLPRQPK